MKKIITVTTFLFLAYVASFAQQINQQPVQQASNAELAKQLLTQSKSQKTISTVLVIGGIVLVGIVADLSSEDLVIGHLIKIIQMEVPGQLPEDAQLLQEFLLHSLQNTTRKKLNYY